MSCVCPDEMRRAQFGEIRLQFHVVTDGHDQMRASIKAFLATMNAYGQPDVDMLTTDNPWITFCLCFIKFTKSFIADFYGSLVEITDTLLIEVMFSMFKSYKYYKKILANS